MQTRHSLPSRNRRALAALTLAALACNLIPAVVPTPTPVPASPPPGPLPTRLVEPVASSSEIPTTEPAPTPTAPPGWLTYRNTMLGYEFDYPPQASLITVGVTGYPTDELPSGVEPGDYIATLEATYTEALCAGVELRTAYLYVGAPDALGGQYSTPCGISGVGAYELRAFEEPVVIGTEALTASGDRGYSLSVGMFLFEILSVQSHGFRFNYGGDWQGEGVTIDNYLADKALIAQVLASWRWTE